MRFVLLSHSGEAYDSWQSENILSWNGWLQKPLEALNKNSSGMSAFILNSIAIAKSFLEEHRRVDELMEKYDDLFLRSLGVRLIERLFPEFDFVIYSPENSSLRVFEQEGQLEPLGLRGEGLLKLLRVMSGKEPEKMELLKEKLSIIDWFDGFAFSSENGMGVEERLYIRDRFLSDERGFDQRSANEGFLFLLFYFALFLSKDTPRFFAIDNIDASLNPKLCSQLMKELVGLAKEQDKQVVFTTHNPAILDGLNLLDEEQKLYVVSRNKQGHTKLKRVSKSEPLPGHSPLRLSEAFLRGLLGGLPRNF